MKKIIFLILGLVICVFLTACAKPAAQNESAGLRRLGRDCDLWLVSTDALSLYSSKRTGCTYECDLYFGTGGQEAAVAALMIGSGMQCLRMILS